ncbi:MAG: oligosaccharide repeat unit polymerase [Gammaproteobacteria bacterium]|nr:oligosaccharide repeat unit polymerase [Gammaproteobacteria bacterium]
MSLNFLTLLLISPAALICGYLIATDHILSVLAILITVVSAIPLLLAKRPDFFAPWTYLFYFVLLNVLIRLVLIDFEVNGDATDINGIFYLDKPREFMVESAAILLLGFIFLTVGYLGIRSRPLPLSHRIFRINTYNANRMRWSVVLMLGVSLSAFIAFVWLTFTSAGEFAVELLSQHRGLSEEIGEYKAYGYLRLLIGFSSIVVYLSYIQLKDSDKDRAFYRAAFAIGIMLSSSMAFYSQSRAALIFIFFNLIFISYYMGGRRVPWKAVAVALPAAIVLFYTTSAFRGGSGVTLDSRVTPMAVISPIILNNGGIDASKTGHVIDYIDATQEYKLGSTLVQFVVAIVPRQAWANKPVNIDTFIGEKIYGAETFGASAVPPGFLAEMYMNFWYAGIVFGCLLLGGAMKKIQNALAANMDSRNFILLYVVALQPFGMSVLGSSFSSAMMGSMMSGIALLLVLHFVTVKSVSVRLRTEPVSAAVAEPS